MPPKDRRRSYLWNFFEKISDKVATCNICKAKLLYHSTTNNLKKHLTRKHRSIELIHSTTEHAISNDEGKEIITEELEPLLIVHQPSTSSRRNSTQLDEAKSSIKTTEETTENGLHHINKGKTSFPHHTKHIRKITSNKIKKSYHSSEHIDVGLPPCKTVKLSFDTTPSSSEPQEDPLIIQNNDQVYYIVSAEDTEKETEEPHSESTTTSQDRWSNKRKEFIFRDENCSSELAPVKRTFYTDIKDADLNFFRSLLPDVRRMNSKQKTRLKIKILNEIEDILHSDESKT